MVGELVQLAKLKGTLGLSDDEVSQMTREVRLERRIAGLERVAKLTGTPGLSADAISQALAR